MAIYHHHQNYYPNSSTYDEARRRDSLSSALCHSATKELVAIRTRLIPFNGREPPTASSGARISSREKHGTPLRPGLINGKGTPNQRQHAQMVERAPSSSWEIDYRSMVVMEFSSKFAIVKTIPISQNHEHYNGLIIIISG
jgi:hypothetical protein